MQQRKELLFEGAQVTLELFVGERLLRELLQALGDLAQCGKRRGGVCECSGCGAQMLGDALLLKAGGFRL